MYPAAVVDLAELCDGDTATSGAVLIPLTIADPATITTDPVYAALDTAEQDAYGVYHPSATRNIALLQLGIALSVINNFWNSLLVITLITLLQML